MPTKAELQSLLAEQKAANTELRAEIRQITEQYQSANKRLRESDQAYEKARMRFAEERDRRKDAEIELARHKGYIDRVKDTEVRVEHLYKEDGKLSSTETFYPIGPRSDVEGPCSTEGGSMLYHRNPYPK